MYSSLRSKLEKILASFSFFPSLCTLPLVINPSHVTKLIVKVVNIRVKKVLQPNLNRQTLQLKGNVDNTIKLNYFVHFLLSGDGEDFCLGSNSNRRHFCCYSIVSTSKFGWGPQDISGSLQRQNFSPYGVFWYWGE